MEPKSINIDQPATEKASKNNSFLVTVLSVLLLISVFITGFFAYQTQKLVKEISTVRLITTPTPSSAETIKPIVYPSITSHLENGLVSSPTTITGFVPQDWMFEGVFPIKILDDNRKLIKQILATEKVPGSWTTNKQVEFTSDLRFTTTATNGYIVLEKSNPSGLEDNSKAFEIMVSFSEDNVACTYDAKICPDGSAVGRSGPKCEFAPCPTPKP
jgi:hypothetical protein